MKIRSILTTFAIPVALAAAVAGCNKTPTGQIVAVVNGEEISLAEMNQELQGANIPADADKKLVQRNLLQRIIDRRLLAQAAKKQGIDRDPAFLATQRRMTEDLLVRMYAKRAADGIKIPDTAAIDAFVAANPSMFTQRARLKLDQIQFDVPANPAQLKEFEGDHSLDAVAATLTRLHFKFQRGAGAIDTATIPPPVLKQIEALPAGEPFIVPSNGKVVASVVTGREPILLPAEQMRPIAVEALRSQSLSKIGEARLKEARASAKIDYQPGYSPATQPTKPVTAK